MGEKKWAEKRPPQDYARILSPDGTLQGNLPEVSDEELLRWYRVLLTTRTFDELALRMQRRGEFSVTASSRGEEACGLGVAAAMQAGDWCFPSYRQLSALLYWGVPVERMVAGLMGGAPETLAEYLPLTDETRPAVTFIPYTVFLGANIPHAVGSALADKLNGRERVTVAFLGEGSTSEGDFHDGLNFAGVFETPCVIVIQNNQWCISVPAARQTAAETFAQKAIAYGLPHARVDGNDVFALYHAASEAIDRARAGGGATLIEAVTYRILDHNTADSSAVYRTEAEAAYWQQLDPLVRFERYLETRGLTDAARREQLVETITAELRQAIDIGRKVPESAPDTMFENHLIGDNGWSFRHQRAELAAELAGRNPFLDTTGEGL